VGLALIAVGAILAFAVTTNTSVFKPAHGGWVLIMSASSGSRSAPRLRLGRAPRVHAADPLASGARVEEVTYRPT